MVNRNETLQPPGDSTNDLVERPPTEETAISQLRGLSTLGLRPFPVQGTADMAAAARAFVGGVASGDLEALFPGDTNAAVEWGVNSGGLVNVSLPAEESRRLATNLPDTGLVFGPDGAPDANRVYLLEERIKAPITFRDTTIAGGNNGSGIYTNTGGQYDPVGNSWTATSTTGAPSARQWHTAVWTGANMIVWGGNDNTGGQYDPVGNSWTATTTTGAPTGRSQHTAVWTGTKMIVWGGQDAGSPYPYVNTGGQYDPVGNSWTATSTIGAPPPGSNGSAVWTGTKMIVWGGFNGGPSLNTGGHYDPAGDSWTATSAAGAPTARKYHTAVWTGTEMIVWGGLDSTNNALNTGGQLGYLTLYVKN